MLRFRPKHTNRLDAHCKIDTINLFLLLNFIVFTNRRTKVQTHTLCLSRGTFGCEDNPENNTRKIGFQWDT